MLVHKTIGFFRRHKAAALATALLLSVPIMGGVAVATVTTTTVDPDTLVASGFTTLQNKLLGYLGLAILLVLAVAGVAIGITMLVRWAKRAAKA